MAFEEIIEDNEVTTGFDSTLKNLKRSLEYSIDSIDELLSFDVKSLEDIEDLGLEDDIKELIHDWHGTRTQRQNTEIVKWIEYLENIVRRHSHEFSRTGRIL